MFLEEQETEKRSTTDTGNANDKRENDKRLFCFFKSAPLSSTLLILLYNTSSRTCPLEMQYPQYILGKHVAWHEDTSNRHENPFHHTLKAFTVHDYKN